jgi:hypothetical protein
MEESQLGCASHKVHVVVIQDVHATEAEQVAQILSSEPLQYSMINASLTPPHVERRPETAARASSKMVGAGKLGRVTRAR